MATILFTPNTVFAPVGGGSDAFPLYGSLEVSWDSAPDFPWLGLSPKGNLSRFTNAIKLTESDAFIGYEREGDDMFLVDWAVRDSKGILRKKVTLQPNIQDEYGQKLFRGAVAPNGSLYLLFRSNTLIHYDTLGREVKRDVLPAHHRYQDIAIDSVGDLYLSGSYNPIAGVSTTSPFLEKRSGADGKKIWISTPMKGLDVDGRSGNVNLSNKSIVLLSDGSVLQAISGHPVYAGSKSSGLYLMRINGIDGSLQAISKIDGDASYYSNALFAQNDSVVLRTALGAYDIILDTKPVVFANGLTPATGSNTASIEDSGVNNTVASPMIIPSSFQVNEGDSLNTSLSGFTPGSTLFFKVSGRGINKKDFAAGGVKGSVRVGADGVATISHTLRADKVTEGDESFSIQVFSDKRMRNLLGQSDTVTVFDTSAKAVKTPKAGAVKTPRNPADKNIGRFVEFDDGIKLFSGQTYTHDSVTGRKLLKYGQNALATYCPNSSCTDNNDIRLANEEEDPITGYRSLDALPPGATYNWNFQVNETYFVLTAQYTNGDIKTTSRVVYKGENTFEGNKLVKYEPRLDANVYVNGHAPGKAYSGSVKEVSGRSVSAPFTFRGSDKGGIGTSRQISAYNSSTSFASASQMTAHLNFENGKFFYNGWDANISVNLL